MNVATKWEEVSLKKFQALNAFIMSNVKMTDLDRSIEIYSLLTDNPDEARDALLNMTVDQLSIELSKIHFIVNKYKSKVPETEYDIDGNKYTVQLNLRNMTAAQYIDFQNFYKDYEKNQKYIFLCFLIPKGKKYNEGYDVMELADKLYDRIPITIVTDIMVFLQIIRELNHSYPNLFNAGDEEIDEKGERSSKEISITEEDSSSETNSEFSQKWNWIC